MVRLVIIAVCLILLAILIVLNAGFMTKFNFFGISFESVPSIVVVILSFVAGVVFSFGIYFGNYFRQKIKSRLKKKDNELKKKEIELKTKIEDQKETSQQMESAEDENHIQKKAKKTKSKNK